MIPPPGSTFLNRAPSQNDRWPRALEPGYASADDRSLFSLLDFACQFSSLVHYYDLDNRIAGDWVEFFTHDPVVMMAAVVATDVAGAERRLADLERRVRTEPSAERKRTRYVELFNATLELPRQINRWLRGMSSPRATGTSGLWRRDIETAIQQSLGTPLQRLKAYDLGAALPDALGRPLGLDYSEFTAEWQLNGVQPDGSIYVGMAEADRIDSALPHIRPAWLPFSDAIAGWAAVAKPQLTAAFERGGSHQPHVALFVAFAKLFSTAQASINAFASRRTDFYFRSVLRECNRLAVPDTVHVAFSAANDKDPVRVAVPAGTRLSAGKDADGHDVVYESQNAVSVSSATLATVCTVRVVSGPLVATAADHVVAHRVLSRAVTPDPTGRTGWVTFGSAADEPAGIGFAVSAPSLELCGGERAISIDIHRPRTAPALDDVLARLSAATGLAPAVVLDTVLQQAFVLSVSTASGWLPVATYAAKQLTDRRGPGFTLWFALGEDAPAVACVPGSGVASSVPGVRAHLRQERVAIAGRLGEVSVYPLSVLGVMPVSRVSVRIDVTGLSDVRIENPDGNVDPTKPFPAFGAVPTAGSYLRLRHAELFSKTVSRLGLRIKWFDLPKNRTGFHGYYQHYVIDPDGARRESLFDNQVFRATVTVERPGSWILPLPASDADEYLFRTDDRPESIPVADEMLAEATGITDRAIAPISGPPPGYDPSDGCVRLELTQPSYAFGHSLYAPNMLHAVMAEVPTDAGCEASCREEYSVLLDARRRLEQLLREETGARPAAESIRALSPVGWPRRLARLIRSAYLRLTRSLVVYISRRPDEPSRSGWIIRIPEADASDRRAPAAARAPGPSSRRMVTATLNLTLGMLLDVAYSCLSECLTGWQDALPRGEWRRLRQELTDARNGRASDQLAAFRHLQTKLVEAGASAGADPAPILVTKCHTVLHVASWVRDCETGGGNDQEAAYGKALRANLTRCIGAIQTAYDAVVKRCKDDCLGGRKRRYPNPPYLPQIETLKVDYSAGGPATFTHLLPFDGYRETAAAAGPPPLLPHFAHAGNLYVGFSRLTTPQTLQIYARMGQSEGDRTAAPAVAWEYLAANRWVRLQAPPPRADATHGLQNPGILSLALPEVEGGESTVLSGDLQWLRAGVANPDDYPDTFGIFLHAVKAVRQLTALGADHLDHPLPPNSVAGLVRSVKGIASVAQPSASFGGQPPETDRAFQIRLSERLRHKQRAIVGWDYERLVLEGFPAVLKARTIPARPKRADGTERSGPGHVRVVIVPGPNSPDVADPTAPVASADTLAAIEQTLRTVAGPFVQLQVLNPVYVRIRVTATIEWRETEDPRVCAVRLNTALIAYLSPWRTDVHDDSYCSEPQIAEFITSRDEVEALVSIGFDYDPGDPSVLDSERCLLTSAAAHDLHHFAETAVEAVSGY